MTTPAPSGPRRGRPPKVTAEGLADVALRLWEDRGYTEVSVREIAEEAGVDLRTVHRYYPAKSDVIWGAVVSTFDDFAAQLAATPAAEPVLSRVRRAVSGSMRAGIGHVDRRRLRIIARTPELQSTSSPPFVAWRTTIRDFAAAHLDEPDDLTATALAAAVQSVTLAALTWWAEHPGTAPEDAVDRALRGLERGDR